ncbi:DUF1826 domain-containing protein [Thauera sp. 27]|uniref:DUF1826 domain-containing protein n=1 Tax=Thauera sp. 27 TaxID=305700 RepID=UPI001E372031|nr:DUF1826 domain-containing protein [Thauera sp. 27]
MLTSTGTTDQYESELVITSNWTDRSRTIGIRSAASAGLADTHSGVLRPDHCIESIPLYAVALLKGSLWQDNTGRGIVHRSPAVSSPPRVLAAFDAAW